MWDFFETVRHRHSVRKYQPDMAVEPEKLYALQDTTIAAAYAQLAIVAAGMGSTWVGYFEEDKVCEALKLEPDLIPLALLSLGYPAELPEPSSRRRLDEVVAWR